MKKFLKIVGIVLGVILAIVIGYVVYVFAAWRRVPDYAKADYSEKKAVQAAFPKGKEIHLLTFNVGFGAYEPDFGFFMDGGHESWAFSEDRLMDNMGRIKEFIEKEDADITLIQELDLNSTRTYHLNELNLVTENVEKLDWNWAKNYDSPFLMYPFYQPHGSSVSGILTMSKASISDTVRRSLPIESGVTRVVDLDRCYTKNRIAVDNGRELVLYNVHLSAYTSDGTIATRQLEMLLEDMQEEYLLGNYCICGGDFNKDLSGDCRKYFSGDPTGMTWAQPIPKTTFDEVNIHLVFAYDEETKVASCRNADGPLTDEQFKLTVDGFLVSDNVTVTYAEVVDTGFVYSDHNPVRMTVILE